MKSLQNIHEFGFCFGLWERHSENSRRNSIAEEERLPMHIKLYLQIELINSIRFDWDPTNNREPIR
jgi:hypothetical protein